MVKVAPSELVAAPLTLYTYLLATLTNGMSRKVPPPVHLPQEPFSSTNSHGLPTINGLKLPCRIVNLTQDPGFALITLMLTANRSVASGMVRVFVTPEEHVPVTEVGQLAPSKLMLAGVTLGVRSNVQVGTVDTFTCPLAHCRDRIHNNT
jgi:hypothetical protein